MAIILNGIPNPRIVLYKNNIVVDDFVLQHFEGGDSAPQYLDFEPDFLRHELDPDTGGEVVSELRGFRMRVELYWPYVDADELKKLRKLFDRRLYDEVHFYPFASDKPFYFERVTLDDDNIPLAYHYLLAQRDFTLKLVSARLVDYVPMEDADFITWGNIALQFVDLSQAFQTYKRSVNCVANGEGGFTASTGGYFLYGTESVGGSLHVGANTFDIFETDVMTMCSFVVDDESIANFDKWTIGSTTVGTEPTLNLLVTGNIDDLRANFL